MASPTFIQGAPATNTYTLATSFSQAFASNVTKGNLLICTTLWAYPGTSQPGYTIADTQGNTWVALTAYGNSGQSAIQLFYCLSAKATGANTVTLTWDGVHQYYCQMGVAEYGSGLTFTLDTSAGYAAELEGMVADPVLTVQGAGELIVEMIGGGSAAGFTFTDGATARNFNNANFAMGDNLTAGASYTVKATWLTTDNNETFGAAFIGSVSGGGGPGTGAPPFGWVNTQGDHYNKRGLR